MIARNIAARVVRDDLVLQAMRKVSRELFLLNNLREFAYEDSPIAGWPAPLGGPVKHLNQESSDKYGRPTTKFTFRSSKKRR